MPLRVLLTSIVKCFTIIIIIRFIENLQFPVGYKCWCDSLINARYSSDRSTKKDVLKVRWKTPPCACWWIHLSSYDVHFRPNKKHKFTQMNKGVERLSCKLVPVTMMGFADRQWYFRQHKFTRKIRNTPLSDFFTNFFKLIY